MAPELKPIEPKSSRWEPAADPSDIIVPGLDTTAPPYDQIEQIEQLITIKLQVPLPLLHVLGRYLYGTIEHRREFCEDATHYGQQNPSRCETVCNWDATGERSS